MKEIITRLEKQYKVNINEFIELYEDNVTREDISYILGIGVHKVKTIAASLGLRMAKKYRQGDLQILKEKLQKEHLTEGKKEVIEELVDDVEVLSEHLYKANKALVNCRDQNNVFRKQIREMARCEELEKRVADEVKEVLGEIKIPEIDLGAKTNYFNSELCIMALADLHVGNLTDPEDIGGINNYNFEVFKLRLGEMFRQVKYNRAKNLHIVILGDILQGIIHNNDLIGEQPTVKALVKFVEIFVGFVKEVAPHFMEVEITLTNSNHSRLQEKPVYHKKTFDFDYIIYEFLKNMLPKIKVNYDTSGYNLIELPNNKYGFAFHGDTFRKYNPLNISEVLKVIETCKQVFNIEPHLILNGHFHQYCSTLLPNGGKAVSVGTMMGMDSYAFNNGFVNTPPSQVILEYNKFGDCVSEKVINLGNIK